MNTIHAKVFLLLLCASCLSATADTNNKQEQEPFCPSALGLNVPVVGFDELDKFIGQVIAVVDTPINTKRVRLSGVEVDCPYELRGRKAYAVGILVKSVVTEKQAKEMSRQMLQHDGPGVKYRLYFDLAGRLAEARSFP